MHMVCAQSGPTLCDPLDHNPTGSLSPWASPGKNTGVGCHFLLQVIFLIQGPNLHVMKRYKSWSADRGVTMGMRCFIPVVQKKQRPG